jgi:CHASE1-domain containing sensor protein
MIALTLMPMFAAAGYSLIYLLAGGGLGGAVLIFIIAKMLGK